MNTCDYKLFEVNNSSSEAFQFYGQRDKQLALAAQSTTVFFINPHIESYRQLNKLKVESMLGIGQPHVKRLLTKLFKKGVQKAHLYKYLLDLLSKYMLMLRYMYSTTRYSIVYSIQYENLVEKFLSEVQTGYEDIINVDCYKIENSIQFSHIIIVDIVGLGKMAFGADLKGNSYETIQNLPDCIDLNPVNYYSVIERGILNDFSEDLHLRFKQLAIERKSEYDKTSFSRNDYICYDDYVGGFYKRLEDTILYENSSRSLSLYNLYVKRVGISEPGCSIQHLRIETDAELACIRIKTSSRKEADELLCYLHYKLSECPWYIWSESNDLETACLVICYRHGLYKMSNERYKFEAEILSKVSIIVADYMNGLVENLLPDVISVENYYVPAYGPVQVNLNFRPYSSFSKVCRLNYNVLKATNMLWLLDEERPTMCHYSLALEKKSSEDKIITFSENVNMNNDAVKEDGSCESYAIDKTVPLSDEITLSDILGVEKEELAEDDCHVDNSSVLDDGNPITQSGVINKSVCKRTRTTARQVYGYNSFLFNQEHNVILNIRKVRLTVLMISVRLFLIDKFLYYCSSGISPPVTYSNFRTAGTMARSYGVYEKSHRYHYL